MLLSSSCTEGCITVYPIPSFTLLSCIEDMAMTCYTLLNSLDTSYLLYTGLVVLSLGMLRTNHLLAFLNCLYSVFASHMVLMH